MNYIPTLDSFMTAFSSLSLLRMLCSGSRFSEIFALGKCDRYTAFRMLAGRGGGGSHFASSNNSDDSYVCPFFPPVAGCLSYLSE